MAITYGFFNSIDNDRVYGCDDFNEWFSPLVSDGVFAANNSQALQVVASNGLTLIIRAGEGRFGGYWFNSSAAETITIPTPDVTMPRIDRIVVRVSKTNRTIGFAVLKGAVASSPVAPALTRNASTIEFSLAKIYVRPNATSISQSSITDERYNKSLCGIVTGLINQIDTSTMALQFEKDLEEKANNYEAQAQDKVNNLDTFIASKENEFTTWFNSVKAEVQSTTILTRYSSSYTTTKANEKTIPINISAYNPLFDYICVLVNGMDLVENVEYTLTNTTVELITPLEAIGTKVTIYCYQSNNGA